MIALTTLIAYLLVGTIFSCFVYYLLAQDEPAGPTVHIFIATIWPYYLWVFLTSKEEE